MYCKFAAYIFLVEIPKILKKRKTGHIVFRVKIKNHRGNLFFFPLLEESTCWLTKSADVVFCLLN